MYIGWNPRAIQSSETRQLGLLGIQNRLQPVPCLTQADCAPSLAGPLGPCNPACYCSCALTVQGVLE
jgi:hypothetical protein